MDALAATLIVPGLRRRGGVRRVRARWPRRARKHDIITFGFFAAVTGVGGGTLRDLLIGAPVFWVARPEYIVVCLAAAVAVWVLRLGPARRAAAALARRRWAWPPTPWSAR